MTPNLTVTVGELLELRISRYRGGLARAVANIQGLAGPLAGSRATFSKLYAMENVDDLGPADRQRLWLLLMAIGESPAEWGVSDDEIPPVYRAEGMKAALTGDRITSWIPGQRPCAVPVMAAA